MAAWIGLIGTAVSAIGQKQAGDAAETQANQNAALGQAEGRLAESQAMTAETTQRQSAREFLGRQQAAFAESGVTGGSSTHIMNQSAINAELDALNVRYRGQLTKFGYNYNANSMITEGQTQKRNSNLLAGATLLRGASNYYASAHG